MTTIHLTQPIDAPLERVWRACTEPSGLAAWQADRAEGRVQAGESVMLSWPALSVELSLTVAEIDHHRRLTLIAGSSELSLVFEPGGISLFHDGVGDGDELAGATSSWRMSLAILAHYCERHAERRRTVRWLVRDAHTSSEAAHVFFTDRAALATWLGSGGGLGERGSRFDLELAPGERLSGSVIANTPGRDVALTWDEDGGSVLCLRTLPRPLQPEQRWIALSWSRWSETPPSDARLEQLDAAHHRLVRALDSSRSA
jgi:uncharacterized protein YndB with AHSA1/START domain